MTEEQRTNPNWAPQDELIWYNSEFDQYTFIDETENFNGLYDSEFEAREMCIKYGDSL